MINLKLGASGIRWCKIVGLYSKMLYNKRQKNYTFPTISCDIKKKKIIIIKFI